MLRHAPSYSAIWDRFTRLEQTEDSLMVERQGWRRWLALPYIAFIVPVDDPALVAQLGEWQRALRPWLVYDPQPAARLHITLHYIGGLRRRFWQWLPYIWRRAALPLIAERVRYCLDNCCQFEVQIGPLNAFPNVLFAEVGDPGNCLHMLRVRLRRVLPLRARPPLRWPYVPHVTLGYWGRQPAAPAAAALWPFREVEPLPLPVSEVHFTVYTLPAALPGPDVLHTAQEEIIARFQLKERSAQAH